MPQRAETIGGRLSKRTERYWPFAHGHDAQSRQADDPAAANVPKLHAVQVLEPAAAYVPGGHCVHVEVSPSVLNVPAGHCAHK